MPNALDLAELLSSWELHLRAERKSGQTVKSYGDGVRAYLSWCAANGRPAAIDRCQLREFIDGLLTAGQPKTLDEIGKVYGVTRERIRQIESKTMSKLRHPSRSQVLRDYLD